MTKTKGKCEICGRYCDQCVGPIDIQNYFIPPPTFITEVTLWSIGRKHWRFLLMCLGLGLLIDLWLGWL